MNIYKNELILPGIGVIAFLILVPSIFQAIMPQPLSVCDSTQQDHQSLSCGEKVLLIPPGSKTRVTKQNGFDAIKAENYSLAIEYLKTDWDISKDPETSIALENAKLASNKAKPIKTIAVVVPASQTPIFIPTGILKGVAYAQSEWNQNPAHPWSLRVVIADDANDPSRGKMVAQELIKRSDIIAVIGDNYSQAIRMT